MTPRDAPTILSAASYNIHGCVGTDGRRMPERVGEVIASLDTQIVGLQEVDCRHRLPSGSRQLDVLSRMTGMHAIAGPTMGEGEAYFGNALLTHLPVLRVQRHDLSVPRREPRGLLEVLLELPTGEPLRVMVAHFGLRYSERGVQARRTVAIARASMSAATVLMGDFNEWLPRAPLLRRLEGTFGEAPSLRTFPSRLPVLGLDRIWAKGPASILSAEAPRTPRTRKASDHLPLRATLRIPRRAPPL